MVKKITSSELVGLSPKEANFVIEYTKDFDARRAAKLSGYAPDTGYQLTQRDVIAGTIQRIVLSRAEDGRVDAEWVLMEAVDNHYLARQRDNLTASNAALTLIARHKLIDAFAADKIKVSTDADVVDRLDAARQRVLNRTDVSFM